ncbi:MAG: N-6 DNA methylase [Candidatus Micrarchaeaceae archaeon]
MDLLEKIFSPSEVRYGLSLFSESEKEFIKSLIVEKEGSFTIKCLIKDKYKPAKPEEIVRQLFIHRLISEYNYPKDRIDVERVVHFGSRDSGLADIVVMHEDMTHPFIIFEVKRPRRSDGLEQLKSYCNAEGAPIGVWSNGNEIILLHREEPNIFTSIPRIPKVTETLNDVLTEPRNIKWLEGNDELKKGKTTLKKIILDLEELVLGNAGVDSFDEIFKLIYAKLYDEWKAISEGESYQLEFSVRGRSPEQVKKAVGELFEKAKKQWRGVFESSDKIELRGEHLTVCVSFLEKIKLFDSNLQIIDEAFEYLIPQVSKRKEGQFFTPRPVIDMVVKMLNPKYDESMIDPSCGSCGFTLHSILWIAEGKLTANGLPEKAKDFAQNRAFGIDFAKKAVKISKAINLIAGDGKTHVYKANALSPFAWDDETKSGLRERLLQFEDSAQNRENEEKFIYFDFDIVMSNPPFAGTIKEREILRMYRLAEKGGLFVNKIGRHILFLERALQFARPGGRIAIVLPQGIFNNQTTEYVRRFIMEEARILAVVGLHGNTFKPHTGTKTSILFLQKYTDEEKEKIQYAKIAYENDFENYLDELENSIKDAYQNCDWNTAVDEELLPEELKAFLDSYFGGTEEIEETENETITSEENEIEKKSLLSDLINEYKEILDVFIEKRSKVGIVDVEPQKQKRRKKSKDADGKLKDDANSKLREEVIILGEKVASLRRKIRERTLGGQIWLVFNDEKITNEFKQFWVDGEIIKRIDYPIFMAVNKKPIKDNSGEYRYKKNADGSFILDEFGYPIIDHDLDEIAEAFIKFAKEQGFYFWRE